MNHFNGLSPAEAERLAHLVEELGEAILAAGKVLRHGYASHDPIKDAKGMKTNRIDLQTELGHVQAAIKMMEDVQDLDRGSLEYHKLNKINKVRKWMHHQEDGQP